MDYARKSSCDPSLTNENTSLIRGLGVNPEIVSLAVSMLGAVWGYALTHPGLACPSLGGSPSSGGENANSMHTETLRNTGGRGGQWEGREANDLT